METTKISMMKNDLWLERWLPLIKASSLTATVLELGCGTGWDTAYLSDKGLRVLATDISRESLQACARDVPAAEVMRHDLRDPLPFPDQHFGVVIASLCLHYFEWQKTKEIVEEIHRCLFDDGLLICRVNSTKDFHHGAAAINTNEPNYFMTKGKYSVMKRFFDLKAVESLFGRSWHRIAIEEMTIDRYEKPKVVWEIALQKKMAL